MCSFHQKDRLINSPNKLECPACGMMSMTVKKGVTTLADGVKIPDITRWVCAHCGEELYDAAALLEIRHQRVLRTKQACA
jgi:ribosomal protein L37AE/L43A